MPRRETCLRRGPGGGNTYSSSTAISAGTLQIGNAVTTGTLDIGNFTDDATLSFSVGRTQ